MPRYDQYDPESFERPKRRTQPRTKDRPSYDNAETARVLTVDRGRITCLLAETQVTAMRARALGRKAAVVGDEVSLVGDLSGAPGSLARIVAIKNRQTTLRRTADDTDPVERIVVANAEQLVIVSALANPEPRTGFIDRAIVAAHTSGITPILCFTKADLAPATELLQIYRPLNYPTLVLNQTSDITELHQVLANKINVFIGHSGVGKSTLFNRLLPNANRNTGAVNQVTGRGRHTSTNAVMSPMPTGGWLIDTPGIRSFGLAHVSPAEILAAFPEFINLANDCPRGCDHRSETPECGLDSCQPAQLSRLESFRKLISTRAE